MSTPVRSGAVFEGVDNASCWATQQLDSLWWIRRCSIAIANDTDHTWTHPKCHLAEGKLVSMPLKIPPGSTGLIGVNKTVFFATGTSGILSYQADGLNSGQNRLQVGWSVPYMGSNRVHVRVGSEEASETLYSRFRDYYGFTSAADSCYTELLVPGNIQADVFMGVDGHAILVVLIKKHKG